MKKYLALALIAPLLISCSTTKKGDTYNEAWVKDTNGFDILMGQFAHNIENIWGFKEVVIAGPKDYVKYTDQYQTRSHINFDDGTITIETIAGTEPAAHLRRAIIKRAAATGCVSSTASPLTWCRTTLINVRTNISAWSARRHGNMALMSR